MISITLAISCFVLGFCVGYAIYKFTRVTHEEMKYTILFSLFAVWVGDGVFIDPIHGFDFDILIHLTVGIAVGHICGFVEPDE